MIAALASRNARTFASVRTHRNFRLYLAGQFVSLSGTWMQDTALAWLVFGRTHSSFDVGLLVFFRFTPMTVFTLFAGVFADRFDNRRALISTNGAAMAVAGALAGLTLAGAASLPAIYALAFIGGAVAVFNAPNRLALTFQLVGRDELANAIALNSSLFSLSRVIGPAVGGVVIAAAGAGVCFTVNAASYIAALAALLLMRVDEMVPLDRSEQRAKGTAAIREGLSYVRHEPGLRLILLMTAVIGIAVFNFRVTLPVLTSSTLHAGPGVFGFLYASFGVGALIGALVAAGAHHPTWKRLLAAIMGLGLALVAIAPLHSITADALLLFVAGVCSTLFSVTSQSILQLSAPDHLRGRVLSLYWFVFAGLTPIGSLLIGWLASAAEASRRFSPPDSRASQWAHDGLWRARRLDVLDPIGANLDPRVESAAPISPAEGSL